MKTSFMTYSTHLISYENEFLSGAQIEQLRKVFAAFDIDESGSLEKEELKQLVQKLNLHAQKDSIDMLLYSFDVNNSKSIEFNEFVQIFGTPITEKEVEKNAKIVRKIQ
jgi:Ca2+-binding EF-hand superfamily protein